MLGVDFLSWSSSPLTKNESFVDWRVQFEPMPPQFLSQELEAAPSKDPTKAEISILEQESEH